MSHTGDGAAQSGKTTPRTITDADVVLFGGQTGDYSRMHFDRHLASTTGRGNVIVHGLLGASFSLGGLIQQEPALLCCEDPDSVVERYGVNHRKPVSVGDTLHTRWQLSRLDADGRDIRFEVLDQSQQLVGDGELGVRTGWVTDPVAPWTLEAPPDRTRAIWYLEDYCEGGQQGETRGRTLTETDIVCYASLTGDHHPLSIDREFAARSRFGQRLVQPMLCFDIGFAAWLRQWQELPLPDSQFAGHLRDEWRVLRPVFIGDTLRCRYRTLGVRRSRSRPEMGVLTFGLQLMNQRDEVVQQGQALMMYPARPV